MGGQIFINYRRDDGAWAAGRLYDVLSSHFGSNHIFMDVDLDAGIDFVEAIGESVGSCDVLIAIIGERWLVSSDEQGRRRLDNSEDFVRIEIATALKRGIRVIPVLLEDALMPPSGDLPDDLKSLVRRNALEVSHSRFRADSERLIGAVERALEKAKSERRQREEEKRSGSAMRGGNSGQAATAPVNEPPPPQVTGIGSSPQPAVQKAPAEPRVPLPDKVAEVSTGSAARQEESSQRRLLNGRTAAILVGAGVFIAIALGVYLNLNPRVEKPTGSEVNQGSSARELKSAAVTVGNLGNPFFVQIARGAEAKAKEINPNVKFAALSSDYDVNNQTNQMDNLISSGVNLILLSAADSKGIAPAVKRAKEAGVAVIAVDVGAGGGVDATVVSNNRQAGQQAATYIVDRLKGKGQIVIVNGPPVTAVQDRVAGARDVFSKNPGIKVLSQDQNAGGSRDGGLRVMTDLLTAFPKIDAVFAINDPSGIGADLAAKQANRSEFFIVGVDGSPDAVAALKSKGSLFEATAAQDPYAMAQKAVEVGVGVVNGKKPESDLILMPTQLITRENVNDYKGWTK